MVVLTTQKYDEICKYIKDCKDLWIECELNLASRFPEIDPLTLGSIFLTQKQNWMKQIHFTIKTPAPRKSQTAEKPSNKTPTGNGRPSRAQEILGKFELKARSDPSNGEHILRLAKSLEFSPVSLVRKLLITKYPDSTKAEITEMIRNPDIIPDPAFALNASVCVYNDNLESGLSDISRRCIGEEYEVKLKTLCRDMGLIFFDEGDLRREGYDKTPDMKLAIPFLFAGKVVNWIESKALFGDLDTHKEVLKKQLLSYVNRFGHGVVIYWFGYLDGVPDYEENGPLVTVLDKFPDATEVEQLKIS